MNEAEIQRLAAAVNCLRTDWPVSSLRKFIASNLATRAYRDTAAAMVFCATDPDTLTPARVLGAGPWWSVGGTSAATRVPPRFEPEPTPGATTEQVRAFARAARQALTQTAPKEPK